MKKTLIILLFLTVITANVVAQTIYKPKGCSASIGPGVSATVLQHPQDRCHLLTLKWSDIETSPGVFTFTALQNQINMVKSYNKKYALAIASGGPGSPAWLINTLNAPYVDYLFRGTTPYKLPLWWDTIVQQRISIMVTALGNQFASDTSLALVYVTQMSANGNEGHLNGINMDTMYNHGFTPAKWINAAKQTTYYYANSFPDKAIAFEVHEVDTSAIIPSTIINDLYNDASLCKRVGAATWWLSGKTTYQTDLLTVLQNFKGDKYAQMIAKSSEPERFKDSLIATAFAQAKQLNIRYIEPWLWEYSNNTINPLLNNFNAWADSAFVNYYSCSSATEIGEVKSNNTTKISLYPNPTNDYIYLSLNGNKSSEVEIYNLTGQRLKSFKNENKLFIGDLSNGTYFIRTKTDDITLTAKFIINRTSR